MHKRRIARGARWLDEQYGPGWAERVRVGSLNPDSNYNCVLGQIEGDFTGVINRKFPISTALATAMDALRVPDWAIALSPPGVRVLTWVTRYGFSTMRETDQMWRNAWAEEVNKRLPTTFPPAWAEEADSRAKELV